MKKDTPKGKRSERKEAWIRLLVIIVCGIVAGAWSYLAGALILLNWLYAVFFGKRNKWMAEFNEYYATYLHMFTSYASGVSNEYPFPFNELVRISKFKE